MSGALRKCPAPPPERETPILVAIRAALHYEPGVVVFRNNCGAARMPGRTGPQLVRFGLGTGSADLVGLIAPGGRFFALEVKSPTGRARVSQETWLARVRELGGFAAVVRSVADARAALGRARAGLTE